MQAHEINAVLAQYGASFSDAGEIIKNGPSGVKIVQKRGRMRFEGAESSMLLMTGPIKPATIESFVQEFWFWKKV